MPKSKTKPQPKTLPEHERLAMTFEAAIDQHMTAFAALPPAEQDMARIKIQTMLISKTGTVPEELREQLKMTSEILKHRLSQF